jgi:hypothetical protein
MTYENDISQSLAQQAHAGTSFSPEKRGRQDREEYARQLEADRAMLEKYATTPEKQGILEEEFARYREGFKAKYAAWLSAKGRCVSWMIAGRANFPVRRAEKANEAEHRRYEEMAEWRQRALNAIVKRLTPELKPIMAGDSDAVERLKIKIAAAEEDQDLMKRANAAHKAGGWEAVENGGFPPHIVKEGASVLKHQAYYGKPFPPYALSNNNANIRRLKARLAQIERAKATPAEVAEGALARFEDSPADNRVRVYFPGKPVLEVRERLKAAGFHYSGRLNAWQAHRNHRSLVVAREEAGVGS